MLIMIVMVMVKMLLDMGDCTSSEGGLFRIVRSRSNPICAKDPTELIWIDAHAKEMKDFKFLMSCASTFSCKGVQIVENGSGYYWLQKFPTALTLNAKGCQMFYKDGVCLANLSSWGFIDVGATSLDSFIEILGGQKFRSLSNGFNTAELDPVTCNVSNRYNFNTQHSSNRTYALRDYLMGLENGTIVFGVTYDEPSEYLALITDYLVSVNLNVSSIQDRGKVTFAWQKGFPEKTVFNLRNGIIPLNNLVAITGGRSPKTTMTQFTV